MNYLIRFFSVLLCLISAQLNADTLVAILGDSITKGHGVAMEDAYPYQVELRLREKGYAVNILNAGITGSTTSSGLARIKALVERDQPDVILIELGANDGLRTRPIHVIYSNLDAMIEHALASGTRVILAAVRLPEKLFTEKYRAEFADMYDQLAAKYNVPLIPSILEGVAMRPEYNLSDRIHPNEKGHLIITETILPYIESML